MHIPFYYVEQECDTKSLTYSSNMCTRLCLGGTLRKQTKSTTETCNFPKPLLLSQPKTQSEYAAATTSNTDKPCYYHYHYHYRSDRPLDKPHNLIDNDKLSKQKTAKDPSRPHGSGKNLLERAVEGGDDSGGSVI